MNVNSFKHACKLLNIPATIPDYSHLPKHLKESFEADYQLKIIIEAQNEGHVFDWENYEEDKWNVVMNMSAAGGPAFDYSAYGSAYSGCGSRLSLRTKADSDYVGTKFSKLYAKAFKAK